MRQGKEARAVTVVPLLLSQWQESKTVMVDKTRLVMVTERQWAEPKPRQLRQKPRRMATLNSRSPSPNTKPQPQPMARVHGIFGEIGTARIIPLLLRVLLRLVALRRPRLLLLELAQARYVNTLRVRTWSQRSGHISSKMLKKFR